MIIALDLETTGLDAKKDKVLEVALVKFDEKTFEIIDTFSTLINPLIPIPQIVSNITNIFDKDILDAPTFDQNIIKKIKDFIGEDPILGHNTNFDRDFLINNGVDIKNNIVLDTFFLSNIVFLYEKSLNLGSLCEVLGVKLNDAHRALDDTLATIALFEKIVGTFASMSKQKKELINFLFSAGEKNTFEKYKKILNIDFEVISFEKFTKNTLNVVGKYEFIDNPKEKLKIDITDSFLKDIFKNLPKSELRENQLEMTFGVKKALFDYKKIIIEAPTGVGKTFAYLIPSIFKSLKTQKQIIVSTNTKALQDQIYYKDLDFLFKNIGYDFSYCKLKGKRNYISILKYLDYISVNTFLSNDEVSFFSKICLWLFDTEFGELDELNIYPQEYFLSKNINSDDLYVLSDENEFKSYEFLHKARTKAQKADIVIVNHSLLVQDLNASQSIFGQIENLIIDEAHNLEDTITDASISSFTYQSLKESFDRILNTLKKHNFFIDNLDIKFENILMQVNFLFDLFCTYANKQNSFGNENFQALIENSFFVENKDIDKLTQNIEILFIEAFNILQTSPDKVYKYIKQDVLNLEDALSIIKITSSKDLATKYISIFSINKSGLNSLSYTVLTPGDVLKNILWDKVDSIVLTSATLTINDSFDYIKNILYLKDFDFLQLLSDFDYKKQVLLFIPNDLGSIKYSNAKIFDFLINFLTIVKGNTLLLFTSYTAIKDMYLNINIPLKKSNISLLAQGVGGSKHKIINHFKSNPSGSVILGTDSFWEGIDFPGSDLKYLFIHKFPFLVPTDPIFKARGKLYSNSFRDYSIPKAILKTRQGFGRLIRTKDDTGIVVLLDDRYFSTSWGFVMRESFPKDINIKIGSGDTFLDLIKSKNTN